MTVKSHSVMNTVTIRIGYPQNFLCLPYSQQGNKSKAYEQKSRRREEKKSDGSRSEGREFKFITQNFLSAENLRGHHPSLRLTIKVFFYTLPFFDLSPNDFFVFRVSRFFNFFIQGDETEGVAKGRTTAKTYIIDRN